MLALPSTPELEGEWESSTTPGEAHQEVMHPPPDHWVAAVSDPETPLPDVLLIVEDLLLQARRLADSGAPTEAVEAILNDMTALREGGS